MSEPAIQLSPVREADINDLPWILDFGAKFAREIGIGEPDTASMEATAFTMMMEDNGILLMADGPEHPVGMVGGAVFPLIWNMEVLLGQESFWWVEKDQRRSGAGVQLLDAFEAACIARGASTILMLCEQHMRGEAVAKFYESRGYELREQVFQKRV